MPGGVGPMTIAMLMDNTITAACSIKGIDRNSLQTMFRTVSRFPEANPADIVSMTKQEMKLQLI